MTPQLLIAGHIVKDITADDWRPGGGALYAAAQAAKLGIDVAAVTVCDSEIKPEALVPDVDWHVVPASTGTAFENTYAGGKRTQRVEPGSPPISLADIPEDWRRASMVLLMPVFHDVSPDLGRQLNSNSNLVGLGAQGWLRRTSGDQIRKGVYDAKPAWLHGDVVFVSEEDLEDADAVAGWQSEARIVVLTRGRRGCTVWHDGRRDDVPAVDSRETDPTGAGDVFAAAFLVRYHESSNAVEAARFGASASALSVQASGIDAIANRTEIGARMAREAAVRG